MKSIRNAAKAVIIESGRLLVIECRDEQGLFYLLPGGGQRFGETLPEALRRECREEIGVDVEVGPFLLMREYIGAHHEWAAEDSDAHQLEFMFECRIKDGQRPQPGAVLDQWQTGIDWLPLERLSRRRIYPRILGKILPDSAAELTDPYLGDTN